MKLEFAGVGVVQVYICTTHVQVELDQAMKKLVPGSESNPIATAHIVMRMS